MDKASPMSYPAVTPLILGLSSSALQNLSKQHYDPGTKFSKHEHMGDILAPYLTESNCIIVQIDLDICKILHPIATENTLLISLKNFLQNRLHLG